ncbi:MAG: hypothetical protein ABIA76_00820 [Candidatus Diapherotrites archaeon]
MPLKFHFIKRVVNKIKIKLIDRKRIKIRKAVFKRDNGLTFEETKELERLSIEKLGLLDEIKKKK